MFASGCGTLPAIESDPVGRADGDRADTRGLSDPYLAIAGLYSDPVGADRSVGVRSLLLGGSPDQYNQAVLTLFPEQPTQRIEGTFTLTGDQIMITPVAVTTTCSLRADCGYGYTCQAGACVSKGPIEIAYTPSAQGLQATAPGLPSQSLIRGGDLDYFSGGAFQNRATDKSLERVWFAQWLLPGDIPVIRDSSGCRTSGGGRGARASTSWADGDEDLLFSLGTGVLDLWGSATATAPHTACGAYTDVRVVDHRYVAFTLEGQGTFDLFARLVDNNGVKTWHDVSTGAAIPFCQQAGDTECAPPLPPRF
jgi:hypothetical protein